MSERSCAKHRTCYRCKIAKIKCDKNRPCRRCERMGVPCQDQARQRGRPSAGLDITPPPYIFQQNPVHIGDEVAKTVHQQTAAAILHAFVLVRKLNLLCPTKTFEFMRYVALCNRSWRRDLSYGILNQMQFLDFFSCKNYRLNEPSVRSIREIVEVLELRHPSISDLQFARVHPFLLMLDDGVSAILVTSVVRGALQILSCNERFQEMFDLGESWSRRLQAECAIDLFLYVKLIAIEDRSAFINALIQHLFSSGSSQESELFLILKCLDRYGNKFLGMVRFRMVVLGEGDYVSAAISISPTPSSKYILLGEGQHQNFAFHLCSNNHPLQQGSTSSFYERRACKKLDKSSPKFFSYLDEHELASSLEPCFKIWLASCSPQQPASDESASPSSGASSKEQQQGGRGLPCCSEQDYPTVVPPVGAGTTLANVMESLLPMSYSPTHDIMNSSLNLDFSDLGPFEQELASAFLENI